MSKRGRIVTALGIAFVLTYLTVLGGFVVSIPNSQVYPASAPRGGVAIDLVLTSSEPTSALSTAELVVTVDSELLDERGHLTQPLEFDLAASLGVQPIMLPAGTAPGTTTVTMGAIGNTTVWPFDEYLIEPILLEVCVKSCATEASLPSVVVAHSVLPNWQIRQHSDELLLTRTPATVAFGLALLATLLLGAVLSLIVAISTYLGRREPQPALLGWLAALLFATVPIRSFLPGNPPIGSLIDYALVLWVIVAYAVSLALYLAAWMRVTRSSR